MSWDERTESDGAVDLRVGWQLCEATAADDAHCEHSHRDLVLLAANVVARELGLGLAEERFVAELVIRQRVLFADRTTKLSPKPHSHDFSKYMQLLHFSHDKKM